MRSGPDHRLAPRAQAATVEPDRLLSERERDVLTLMVEGRSNKGICEHLFLSPKTVESHIKHIFDKLGLDDSTQDHRRVLAVLTFLRV